MQKIRPWLIASLLAVLGWFLLAFWQPLRLPAPSSQPKPMNASMSFLGFYENAASTTASVGSYPALQRYGKLMTSVSPFWYQVDAKGRLVMNHAQTFVTKLAHSQGLKVLPMVINRGHLMLMDAKARQATVATIVSLVQKNGYDGVVIDFELIPASTKNDLTLFIRSLSKALHPLGKTVGVTVFPHIHVVRSVSGAYDYRALGQAADKVILMAYDEHYNGSRPGPVASFVWVRSNVEYALQKMSPSKLLVGVAAYGYDWPAGSTRAATVSTRKANGLISQYGATVHWSNRFQEPYFHYRVHGVRHAVWYENSYAFAEKLIDLKTRHVAGVALWRLHGETPRFWQVWQTGKP